MEWESEACFFKIYRMLCILKLFRPRVIYFLYRLITSIIDPDRGSSEKNDFLHQNGHENHFSNLEDIMHQIFRIIIQDLFSLSFLAHPSLPCTPIY